MVYSETNMIDHQTTSSINLCVLFDAIDAPTGGGNQFLKALAIELKVLGHRVTNRPTRDLRLSCSMVSTTLLASPSVFVRSPS